MSSLPIDTIKPLADLHPKPSDVRFQYGTAGFRTLCVHPNLIEYTSHLRHKQGKCLGLRPLQGRHHCGSTQQETRWQNHRCNGDRLPQP